MPFSRNRRGFALIIFNSKQIHLAGVFRAPHVENRYMQIKAGIVMAHGATAVYCYKNKGTGRKIYSPDPFDYI